MCYMYAMEYYSAIKKNKIMPFAATWMELAIIMLNEVNQKKKDKYCRIYLHVEYKIGPKWTCLQNRNSLTDVENRHLIALEEGRWGSDGVGVWG